MNQRAKPDRKSPSTRILFAASEAHPLIKTGGLADVAGSLPAAMRTLGMDVRLVLPAYPQAVERAHNVQVVAELQLSGASGAIRILSAEIADNGVPLFLVDSPEHFDRAGPPYTHPDGHDWPDNAQRFATFARAVTALAMGDAIADWKPSLVHCNDWQTGLVPALLKQRAGAPKSVFTIHNLAYQGLFSWDTFQDLGLPASFWHHEAMEFHNQFSYIKGGLVYADHVTTVSPTYAWEIRTPQFGYGLEGLLDHRSALLSGILNGVDYSIWDPRHDPYLDTPFSAGDLSGKAAAKTHLQRHFGLPVEPATPLIAHIGRLVEQKGVDLLLEAMPQLLHRPFQVVVLGSGDENLEKWLHDLSQRLPTRFAAHIGYDEALSHRIEAGADMFIMPSRFEPCGLNQIYSLRYGTVPIVHRTGGLADTVVDATQENLAAGTATGFTFDHPSTSELMVAMHRALEMYERQHDTWHQVMINGMRQDFSWGRSALEYAALYHRLLS
jgi:starch synthase